MEIRSTETIKQAVIAGFGVTFLSAHTVSRELEAGSLRVLDVQGFPLQLHWYVVHRRTKRLPPVAQAFRNFLLSEGASLIAQAVPWKTATQPSAAEGSEQRAPGHQGDFQNLDGDQWHPIDPDAIVHRI